MNLIPEADEAEIQNRLDLTILQTYKATTDIRGFRSRVINGWRDEAALARLALSCMDGLSGITPEEDDHAIRTITDYWLEPIVLPTMNLGQARDYFLAIREQLHLKTERIPLANRPLILETLHHRFCFSVIYATIEFLALDRGFDRYILLHLRNPLDPRLEICAGLIKSALKSEAIFIPLEEGWLETLRREMSERAVVFYMGDMSPKFLPGKHRRGKASNKIHLFAEPDISLEVEGVTVGSRLARGFNAAHHLLDYPQPDTVRLRSWSPDAALHCPLSDWVFWPALRHWSQEVVIPGEADERWK